MRGFSVKRGGGVSKRRGTRKRLTSRKKSNAKKQVPKTECNETLSLSPNDRQEKEFTAQVEDAITFMENETIYIDSSDDDDSSIVLNQQDIDAILDIMAKHRAGIRKLHADETQLESDNIIGNDQNGETSEELNDIGVDSLSPPHSPEYITGDYASDSNSNSPAVAEDVVEHMTEPGDSAKPVNSPLEKIIENARPTRRRKSVPPATLTLAATRTRRSSTSKPSYLVGYEVFSKSKRTFECDMCEKTFYRRNNFEKHHSYHFEPEIPCPKCDKLMHHKDLLYNHVKIHEKKTPKPRAKTQNPNSNIVARFNYINN